MNSWKVILATMVIFGAGVVTGGLLVGHYRHQTVQMRFPGPGPNKPVQAVSAGGMRVDLLRRMSRDLDLTPEQHDQVDKILKDSQDRTRKVMSPFLREELERTSKEFRDILTTNQQARFDGLLKQKQQQRGRDMRHPPQPGERSPDALRSPSTPAVTTNN